MPKQKRIQPTISAIAERAGVSRATVSLILANREENIRRFKRETVARVREIAEQIGYHANLTALSLRGRHPSFFGLILRGQSSEDAMSWHHQAFEGKFLAGALEASRQLNLYPVLATQDSPEHESALERVRGVLDGGVFGAVFRTPLPVLEEPMRRQIERGLPVVIIFPEKPTACPSNAIDVDNIEAGRVAGVLLGQAGRRHWVQITEEPLYEPVRLRGLGLQKAADGFSADVTALSVPPGLEERQIIEWLMPRLRDIRPDGIYAASSVAGVATLLACPEAGLHVPDDTALVGCDAALWRAPGCLAITSVDVSWHAAGELGVRKMVELREQETSTFENIYLPPFVQQGGTCPVAAALAQDPIMATRSVTL